LQRYGIDLSTIDGSGAAGGLGGALAVLGARLVPGFELVAEHTGLAEAVRGADAVITEASWRDPVGCVTQAAEQWLRGR
jgi:glycerate kinase